MATPKLPSPSRRRPVQSVRSGATTIELSALGQTSFLCEGEDARITGMTRSPLRRVLALNLPSDAPAAALSRAAARVA